MLDPYLIQSYDKGKVEGALFIPDTHNVYVLPLPILFANPKSVIFTWPSFEINKFSGFKSLYTIYILWRYIIAVNISVA